MQLAGTVLLMAVPLQPGCVLMLCLCCQSRFEPIWELGKRLQNLMQYDECCSGLVPCLQKLTLECLSGPWELHMMAQSFLESETAAVEVIPQVCASQLGAQAFMPLLQGCCRRLPSVCGHHKMQPG